jgi:hypothetical protein
MLMFVGIALFGWVTASLASLFVENEEKAKRNGPDRLHKRLDELDERLERIERLLAQRNGERELVGSENSVPD